MTNVEKMLDKWEEVCLIPSDNAAAKRLGINRQAIHGWRTGQSYPTGEHVLQIAEEMHEPPENWLLMVQADRARSDKSKAAWARLAARAGIAACLCFALLTPAQSHASDEARLSTITHRLYICESRHGRRIKLPSSALVCRRTISYHFGLTLVLGWSLS